jgi:hypothetical protein
VGLRENKTKQNKTMKRTNGHHKVRGFGTLWGQNENQKLLFFFFFSEENKMAELRERKKEEDEAPPEPPAVAAPVAEELAPAEQAIKPVFGKTPRMVSIEVYRAQAFTVSTVGAELKDTFTSSCRWSKKRRREKKKKKKKEKKETHHNFYPVLHSPLNKHASTKRKQHDHPDAVPLCRVSVQVADQRAAPGPVHVL